MDVLLRKYEEYLNKLADTESSEVFSNGGIRYASILMSVLFNRTQSNVRIFCEGFKPDLINTEPYISALRTFLSETDKSIKVLVEKTDYVNEEPFRILKEAASNRQNDGSILFRQITNEDKKGIFNQLKTENCNFAIFDFEKFRFEYSPCDYKAFGSFNDPRRCGTLISLFDKAFENATVL